MKRKSAVIFLVVILVLSMCSPAFAGRVLEFGMSGDDVYDLQSTLSYLGYFYVDPTGYFGELTEESVFDFQRDYGLDVDGLVGPITQNYLGIGSDDSYSSSNSSSASLSRTLRKGMEGDDVYTLQELLSDYGYFYSYPTGYFGDLTEDAVIDFQYDYDLDVDGVVGPATIGALTGDYSYDSGSSSHSGYGEWYQQAVLDAVERTPSTGEGYCAAWVTWVLENAGILTYDPCILRSSAYSYASTSGLASGWYANNTGWNANDYWAYVCNSTDPDDLLPGMVVATRSSYTELGRQFGHVGIYLGNGQIISSVGYLETLSFDEWNRRYNNVEAGSSIAWGFMPY